MFTDQILADDNLFSEVCVYYLSVEIILKNWLIVNKSKSKMRSDFLRLLEFCPLEFLWFCFWSCVLNCLQYNNWKSDTWIEGNLEQIKIFNSAYDADEAWVKELVIEK